MQDAEMEAAAHSVDSGALDLRLEERLRALLSLGDSPLQQAMREVVFAGGKRMRPRLLLRVALSNSVGGAALELALRSAAAVELIHSGGVVSLGNVRWRGGGSRIFDEVAASVVRLAPHPAAMLQVLGELRAQIDHIVAPRSGVVAQ